MLRTQNVMTHSAGAPLNVMCSDTQNLPTVQMWDEERGVMSENEKLEVELMMFFLIR